MENRKQYCQKNIWCLYLLSSVVEFVVKKILTRSIPYFIFAVRTVSSVGSEHYFDRVGVTGSSPVQSTIFYYNRLAINYFMKYKNFQLPIQLPSIYHFYLTCFLFYLSFKTDKYIVEKLLITTVNSKLTLRFPSLNKQLFKDQIAAIFFCKKDDPTITASLYVDNLVNEVEREKTEQKSINQ